jgi:hypothetical protein
MTFLESCPPRNVPCRTSRKPMRTNPPLTAEPRPLFPSGRRAGELETPCAHGLGFFLVQPSLRKRSGGTRIGCRKTPLSVRHLEWFFANHYKKGAGFSGGNRTCDEVQAFSCIFLCTERYEWVHKCIIEEAKIEENVEYRTRNVEYRRGLSFPSAVQCSVLRRILKLGQLVYTYI